jgi:4-amino-4-deoxy-L-arabinose transferase-like glycosyltransferase
MTRTTVVTPPASTLRSALWLALAFAAGKLLLHIATTLWVRHIGYGYFRDEFYYILCGRHLAWGYVDHGPLVAVQAHLAETIFGDSLLGIRMLSALGGAARVFLTGILCWALGGKRAARALAMLFVITVPIYLGVDSFLSMNSWESMFWMPCLLALILLLKQGTQAGLWWTVFGIAAGLGLLNKPSMAFFLVAMAAALLLTPQRRILFTRQAVWGIALLILIALPNLLWQIHNHWPTLEFLHNGRVEGKNTQLAPLPFLLNQLFVLGPWTALLWLPGLVRLLRRNEDRWLGLTYLLFLTGMIALGAKDYYVAPIYPILFAAGGVAWQQRFASRTSVQQDRIFAFPVAIITALLFLAIALPLSIPVLRPPAFLAYQKALHAPSTDTENGPHSILPQFYADRFGWQEQVDTITRIVNQLSPQDRARVGIFCGNYGEAGALEFLGHNLPPVISEHNNYWLWGTRGLDAEVMIINRKTSPEKLSEYYEEVQVVGHVSHPYGMPFEDHDIYLVRHRKLPLAPDWAASRFYY